MTARRWSAGLALALAGPSLAAGTITEQRIWSEGDRYLIHVEILLDAPADRVRARLTDYDNLHRLSDTIRESRLLDADPPRYTVRLRSRGCIGIFCRDLEQVQAVTERDDGFILVEDLPGRSDFRAARAVWRISAAGTDRSRVSYSAELLPDFWIPPLLGPPLFRDRLARETRQLLDNLERLARETP